MRHLCKGFIYFKKVFIDIRTKVEFKHSAWNDLKKNLQPCNCKYTRKDKMSQAYSSIKYFGHPLSLKRTIKPLLKLTANKQIIDILSCALTPILNWDLSVDKNSLSVSPTDKTLSKYIQTVYRQRLAWQHVSRLQTAFTGVTTEPGANEGLVPSSRGHCTARDHAIVPATWKTMIKPISFIL